MGFTFAENNFESMAEYATLPSDMSAPVCDMSMRVGRFMPRYFISAEDWFPSPSMQLEGEIAYPWILQISGNARPDQIQQTLRKLYEINILQKFAELLSLPPNWDSYEAKPISTHSVEQALRWLASMYREGIPVPSIVPGSDGSVQIEWHVADADLEILFPPHRTAEYYWESEGSVSEGLLAYSDEIDRYIGVLEERANS